MIEFRDVEFSYALDPVVYDISLTIDKGELLGIIGPSGAGKTTLLRLLLQELTPTRGAIITDRHSPLSIGYVPQLDAGERNFPITVEEMVLLGCASKSRPSPWFSPGEKRNARAILKYLDILSLRHSRIDTLSGGQFQRTLIARALMARPSLLVLDEPTSGIDLQTRRQVLDLLFDLQKDGFSIVMTTHDLNWVAAHLPRIVCLNRTVIADGSPSHVLTSDVVQHTYDADMDVITHNGRPVIVDRD